MSKTKLWPGVLVCVGVAAVAWYLGLCFEVVGGPVFGIALGLVLSCWWTSKHKRIYGAGVAFSSKKLLQLAVVLLGFGLNLGTVWQVGLSSLPIICSTIAISLVVAWGLAKVMQLAPNLVALIGIGSSICGGSAIAASAPVLRAKDEEVAQAISVVFLFNVLAALIFPTLGGWLGLSDEGFALFAGTAINDTSSVTAAASTWDSLHETGTQVLDSATVVKLTRTLAIIPITLSLAWYNIRQTKRNKEPSPHSTQTNPSPPNTQVTAAQNQLNPGLNRDNTRAETKPDLGKVKLKQILPYFILYFLLASLIYTLVSMSIEQGLITGGIEQALLALFSTLKLLSKFLIVCAMVAIGLNTKVRSLVSSGVKPLVLGLSCWAAIIAVSLGMQQALGIW